jgi:hypothetical protein
MNKRSTQATLMALLTATLVLPTLVFARAPQKSSGSAPSVQDEQCFVKVETTIPKAKKDISNNEVSCNKVRWGTNGTTGGTTAAASATLATYSLSKKECVDDRGRVGAIKLQRDNKSGQSSKTCAVQQFARGTSTPSQNQQK